jgi:hypothetical protein
MQKPKLRDLKKNTRTHYKASEEILKSVTNLALFPILLSSSLLLYFSSTLSLSLYIPTNKNKQKKEY